MFDKDFSSENGEISEEILKSAMKPVSAGNTGEEQPLKDTGKNPFSREKNYQIPSQSFPSVLNETIETLSAVNTDDSVTVMNLEAIWEELLNTDTKRTLQEISRRTAQKTAEIFGSLIQLESEKLRPSTVTRPIRKTLSELKIVDGVIRGLDHRFKWGQTFSAF